MKTLEGTVTVLNVPDYAKGMYVVAKAYFGELYFWNAWDSEDEAIEDAGKIENAIIVRG